MAENKKSFVVYSDWKGTFDALSDEKAGELIKHIFSYVNDENPQSDDMLINAVFSNIKNALKRDLEKWDKQHQQRIKAGRRSAEVRKENSNKVNDRLTTVDDNTNSSTVSVSVSDSVSDSVIKLDNILMSEIKISNVEDNLKSYFEISFKFYELFIKNLENTNTPTKRIKKSIFKNFVNPVRLMFEQDGVNREQLLLVYDFLNSREGDFWKKNILSTDKLRKQFETLSVQANTKKGSFKTHQAKSSSTYNRADAIARLSKKHGQ